MKRGFAYRETLQDRIAETMDVMRIALDKQAPYLALATAREAARAALLALGQSPRRAGKRELALLREVATATSHHLAGRPAERQALVSATLELLDRLFPRPAMVEERGGGDDRPGAGPDVRRKANPGPAQRSGTGDPSWQ